MTRRVVLKALVGSHNYNLNHEGSDRDYKVFVLPTFEDLYHSNRSTNTYTSETEDVVYHDIRHLQSLLFKSNISYLELLFSEDLTFGETLDAGEGACLLSLFESRESIARMNLPYLYQSTLGTFISRFKLMSKGTTATQSLVEKHGYDTKQAMACARLLDVLIRYAHQDFTDFKSAIWFSDDEPSALELKRIREGAYSLEEMTCYLENKKAYVEDELAPLYLQQAVDCELNDWIHQQLSSLVKQALSKEICSI